jgi:hypothetical protein
MHQIQIRFKSEFSKLCIATFSVKTSDYTTETLAAISSSVHDSILNETNDYTTITAWRNGIINTLLPGESASNRELRRSIIEHKLKSLRLPFRK